MFENKSYKITLNFKIFISLQMVSSFLELKEND